ncbi:glycosyltransferase family 4 protein [Methanococcoides burtonii]|uniref:Glycosyl transferase, group I n=1 Tax=Methanococcoides burtonii (strain DSM 6242 / NBRC 107633 / OCM 468 / ACE-M) TaxID=259564 RepID=Q12VP1_METBU|nr:glycosyltransferase family 4 protein [Methanococcoides burtonii]ABE52485.1 Glycosyl transferase, group I [Methanococcoides burtonii DSM 6242]
MKICLIADAISVHTVRWAEYFAQQGDEVHLITYESPIQDISGVTIHAIRSRFDSLYLAFIPRHLKIYSLVKRLKPDIVHAHFISKFGFHAAFLNFRPVVMSAWGDDILIIPYWSKVLWYFTKKSLKRADKIYAVSDDIAQKIIFDFGISADHVEVIPFGVDSKLFSPNEKEWPHEKVQVLSNRNFYEVYNIETLLHAIPLVVEKYENINFIIKGTGPLESSLKQLAKDLNIEKFIDFVGWIEYKEMPKYLHKGDIYVSTATSDGTPVSVLEAMACKKACIVTDVGGVKEWIEDGMNGILIPPRNPEILAEKILDLARFPDERERLGNQAYKVIDERGDWYRIMSSVRLDYENMVKEHEQ